MGGIIAVTAKAPKGRLFTETNDWTEDCFETKAPDRATAVQLRVAITGKGKVWVKQVNFSEL